jgi:superfamily II DNA or RNA helicase
LEALGSLVPAQVFINPLDRRMLAGVKITAGDYNEKDLAELMNNRELTADLVENKIKRAPGLLTMVFAVNIEHSKQIVEQYNAAGIRAVHVDGGTPLDVRARIFKDFEAGRYEVLSNVGIATYGVDIPPVRCIQLARPTKSLSLYLQMVGRGTRPYTGPEGKKERFLLLDHGNCVIEFGAPNAERKWTLQSTKKQEQRPRQLRIKLPTGEEKTVRDLPENMKGIELLEVTEDDLEMMARMKKVRNLLDIATKNQYRNPMGWAWFKYAEHRNYEIETVELLNVCKALGFADVSGWMKHAVKFLEDRRQLATT